jgi:hypothetical protein
VDTILPFDHHCLRVSMTWLQLITRLPLPGEQFKVRAFAKQGRGIA